jgi:uncharacterized protein YdeI (YjbR/CyaY-like superfamily)
MPASRNRILSKPLHDFSAGVHLSLLLSGEFYQQKRKQWQKPLPSPFQCEILGETMNTLLVRTLDAWRDWLTGHHASVPEVWLIYHKRHTGALSIDYKDALDEALCFGWVDSLVKRMDDRRFARKFTPRRADSHWSAVNRKRYAELKAAGRLKPPGIARPPTNRGSALRPARLAMPSKLPAYIQAELKKHPRALRHFESLPPGERRRYFAWIESAKREETKLRRLKEAIRLLASGKVLGLK